MTKKITRIQYTYFLKSKPYWLTGQGESEMRWNTQKNLPMQINKSVFGRQFNESFSHSLLIKTVAFDTQIDNISSLLLLNVIKYPL